MKIRDSRILITGGTGVLGRYIIEALIREGCRSIEVFSRFPPGEGFPFAGHPAISFVQGDLREIFPLSDCIDRADYIIHAGAMVSFDPRRFREMYTINVEGSANLYALAQGKDLKKIIHISSVSVFTTDDGTEVTEDICHTEGVQPSYYGLTKNQSEMEAWRAYHEGVPVAIVNPSVILGEGDWSRSSLQLFERVYEGLPFYPSGGTAIVDAEDVARAVLILLKGAIVGERYILSAANISYRELLTKMAKSLGVKGPQRAAPKWLLSILWRIEKIKSMISGRAPLVTRETIVTTSTMCHYNHDKSLTLEDFSYTDIDETIEKYARAYVESRKRTLEKPDNRTKR